MRLRRLAPGRGSPADTEDRLRDISDFTLSWNPPASNCTLSLDGVELIINYQSLYIGTGQRPHTGIRRRWRCGWPSPESVPRRRIAPLMGDHQWEFKCPVGDLLIDKLQPRIISLARGSGDE